MLLFDIAKFLPTTCNNEPNLANATPVAVIPVGIRYPLVGVVVPVASQPTFANAEGRLHNLKIGRQKGRHNAANTSDIECVTAKVKSFCERVPVQVTTAISKKTNNDNRLTKVQEPSNRIPYEDIFFFLTPILEGEHQHGCVMSVVFRCSHSDLMKNGIKSKLKKKANRTSLTI